MLGGVGIMTDRYLGTLSQGMITQDGFLTYGMYVQVVKLFKLMNKLEIVDLKKSGAATLDDMIAGGISSLYTILRHPNT